MRLGFHYHIPAVCDEDGGIWMPGYLGRFVDSLAAECDEFICFLHSPRQDEGELMDYRLAQDNVGLVDIGRHDSVPRRTLLSPQYVSLLKEMRDQLDCLLIRGPSPLLPAFADAAGTLPVALLLVGDYLAGINTLPQRWWRKELIRIWSWINKRGQDRVAGRSLVFANSRLLFNEYSNIAARIVETQTTTLMASDFPESPKVKAGKPVRILFTGRLDVAKGILDIAEALRLVRLNGFEVVFDLVGMCQKGDNILDRLRYFCGIHRIPLNYHGFKSLGPELFQQYRESDIFVTASQSSEGFPRTIWEAMSQGLPVIATKVGSISHYLDHNVNALLVEPRCPEIIAEMIEGLINDSELRRRIVYNAVPLAKQNTLDRRAKEMIQHLKDWVECERS